MIFNPKVFSFFSWTWVASGFLKRVLRLINPLPAFIPFFVISLFPVFGARSYTFLHFIFKFHYIQASFEVCFIWIGYRLALDLHLAEPEVEHKMFVFIKSLLKMMRSIIPLMNELMASDTTSFCKWQAAAMGP